MSEERLAQLKSGGYWPAHHAEVVQELVAEVERLKAYEADAADRFFAVVRQRDAAELRLNSLGIS